MHISRHESSAGTRHALPSRRYAWTTFGILGLLMVMDYVDRQIIVSMFPHLKAQWQLSDGELGSLVSIVSIVVALGTVPLSLLADRWSRVKSIVVMALVWSCATIACSFARSYGHLLLARGFVGLGEAAYGSAGVALLASIFPARLRSTVLGAFLGGPRRLGAWRSDGWRNRRDVGLARGLRRGWYSRTAAGHARARLRSR